MQAESSPTFEQKLLDIELPVQPDFDWSAWLHIGLVLLVLFLVFWGVKWLRDYFGVYFRLQRQIRRALKGLDTSVKRADADSEPQHAFRLEVYQWFRLARQHALIGEGAEQDLKAEIDRLCFSRQQQVSHETMAGFLLAFQQAMNDSLQRRPRWYQILWHHGHSLVRQLILLFRQKDGGRHD